MDEKLNRKMDEQLASRVAELDAHNDETGDGKLDAADLKAQLNRIEAQLELQDEQNRSIMKNQRLRMLLTIIITVVLLVVLGLFWNHMDQAYKEVMTACTQVNELADTLQSSLDTLDPDELNNDAGPACHHRAAEAAGCGQPEHRAARFAHLDGQRE